MSFITWTRFLFGFESSKYRHGETLNLLIQSFSHRRSKLTHQTESSRHFKQEVVKNHHTKIIQPVQASELANQVKLGYSYKSRVL